MCVLINPDLCQSSFNPAWCWDSTSVCVPSAPVGQRLRDLPAARSGPQIGAAPATVGRDEQHPSGREEAEREGGKLPSQMFLGKAGVSLPRRQDLAQCPRNVPQLPGWPAGSENVKVTPRPGKQWLQIGAIWAGCGHCLRSVSQTAGWKGWREAI